MRLRNLLKDKHGAMYIKACVLVIIITMVFSVAFYFTTTMVRAKAQRKDAIQTLDQYTQLNAIDIYNSIKNHNDKTDTLDSDVFVASLCSSQGLQVSGDTWVAYTENGGERYRISDIQMRYSVDNTTKITVSYTLTVPLNFLGNTVWIDIPVSINTSLNAKFDETDTSGTATYIVKHWKMNTDGTTYSLDKVWTLTGTVGDKVTPPVKTYEGFVSPATQTVTVKADQSTVVNYYYERIHCTVSIVKDAGIDTVSGEGTYYYGETVTINATVSDGYVWKKWVDEAGVLDDPTSQEATFVVNAQDNIEFVATTTSHTVTLDYGVNYGVLAGTWVDTGYKLNWDKNFQICATVSVPVTGQRYLVFGNYDGYTVNALNVEVTANNELRVFIGADGSHDVKFGKLTAGEDVTICFSWDADRDTYTISAKGPTTSVSGSRTKSVSGQTAKGLRIGALDCRGSQGPFSDIYISNFSTTIEVQEEATYGSLPVVERKGYTFSGWFTAPSGGSLVTDSTKVDLEKPQTLYAKGVANVYKVTLDNQKATSSGTKAFYYQYGTYHMVGGTACYYFADSALTQPIVAISVPSRDGYKFDGYYTATNGSGTQYIGKDGDLMSYGRNLVAEDVTLYAKWNGNVLTVNYYSNYATGGHMINASKLTSVGQVLIGSTQFVYDVTAQYGLNNYTTERTNGSYLYRTGYTGTGYWGTAANGGKLVNEEPAHSGKTLAEALGVDLSKGDASVNVYAQWKANTYTLSFNANGGTVSPTSKQVTYDAAIGSLPSPTRAGYIFLGWFSDTPAKYDSSKSYKDHPWLYYADTNTDLYNAFGYNKTNLRNHYNNYGRNEGRRTWQYLATDVYKTADNLTLYAAWEARTDIKYVVNHYKMDLDGKKYTLDATDTLQGTADASLTLTALAKTYTGFTYSYGQVGGSTVTTTTIAPDGTRVINLYYSRNQYNYTVNHYLMNLDGKTYTLDSSVTDKAYYGASITGTVKTYTGFTSPGAKTITIGVNGNTIDYYYTRNTYGYTVNYYLMNLDGKTYTMDSSATVNGTALYGSKITGVVKTYTGFTSPAVQTITIGTSGNVISYYYTRNSYGYTVNHYLQNVSGSGYTLDSSATVTGTALYGSSITGTVKTYTGFTSPGTQTITISTSGNVISYYYSRNQYTITWKNWDSTVLKTDSVYYGATPTYTGSTPTKPATREGYRWDFTGWTPSVSTVTGAATYTATFTEVLDNVTITWKNWDGTVLATDVVKCGTIPSYGGATPTRASTSSKHYTFSGWSPTVTSATASVTYTATFTEANHTYGTTSYSWNGCSSCTASASCTVCGQTKTETGSITYRDLSDATCTSPDTWEHKATFATMGTSYCPYTHSGSALGHSYSDATCTSPKTCSRCGATSGSALGHSYGSWVTTKEATCTSNGVKTRTCTRTGCSAYETDTISATGHSYGSTKYSWSNSCSSCTASATCSKCSYVKTETGTVSVNNSHAATCTSAAKKDYKATFSTFASTTCPDWHYSGSALGHSYGSWVTTTAATCTSSGVKTRTCTRSGCSATDTDTISALGHNSVSNNDGYAATCTTDGKTDSYSCSRCGATTTYSTTIDALGHKPQSNRDGYAATCTTAGQTSSHSCSRCNVLMQASTTLKALGHNYTYSYASSSTCMGTCTRCSVNSAGAHSKTKTSETAATCTSAKTISYSCGKCGGSWTETSGSELGHNWVYQNTGSASGYEVKYYKCSRCGKTKYTTATLAMVEQNAVVAYAETEDNGARKRRKIML